MSSKPICLVCHAPATGPHFSRKRRHYEHIELEEDRRAVIANGIKRIQVLRKRIYDIELEIRVTERKIEHGGGYITEV